jgi:hypothetical protein
MPSQYVCHQVSLVFFPTLARRCSLFYFFVVCPESHTSKYALPGRDYPYGAPRPGYFQSGSDYTYALSLVPRIEMQTCTAVNHHHFSSRMPNRISTNYNSFMQLCFVIVVVTPSQLQLGKHSTCAETGQSTNQQTSTRNRLTLVSPTSSSWLQNCAAQRNRRADLAHPSCPMLVSTKSLL